MVLNFVHSGATDDEMVLGINGITEICRRVPQLLLETEDGKQILSELMGYSNQKSVLHSKQKGKTSGNTRKGVVMAARGLVNLYRKVAPGFMEKKFLGRSEAVMLQDLKKQGLDTKFIKTGEVEAISRIQNIDTLE